MNSSLARFLNDDSAVSAIEYGLLAALIALVIIVGVSSTGSALGQIYTYIQINVSPALK